ncbi:alanine racemase [Rhodococcus antarcticus]|jgi:alanine racemase|uniref:Alanine racemase n=1 Tax=Rhodococcus antarcticus TaxID=2987751 RepID=A0ABY6P144_9NOCA|nr:alanine racemase [Rhodococcus antarcticus]UZJ25372.1 alanine racemase [Rhodococcus antarcticus]
MSPRAEAVVDLDAIAHNVRTLDAAAGSAGVMAVVKADGYGHGAVATARTALAAGAVELGVATVDEALQLRTAGITAPVLSWLHAVDDDFGAALAADVQVSVSSPRHLSAVLAAARATGRTAVVSLKVDTGLNRNGVSATELDGTLVALAGAQAEGAVRLRGVFSHLARADEPTHPVVDAQAARLREVLATAARHGLVPEVVHLANSAATLTRPDLSFDLVRPGIAVYGLSPVPALGDLGLRPAMTLRARVALVKRVAAGQGVSYGHVWTAPADTTVALLPVGYADGVPRGLSTRFDVLLGGVRRPVVGRVCMDQLLVDCGPDGGGVAEGDTAVLFGPGGDGEPRAQDWADTLGTIHYEVVTGVRGRVRRTHVGAGA